MTNKKKFFFLENAINDYNNHNDYEHFAKTLSRKSSMEMNLMYSLDLIVKMNKTQTFECDICLKIALHY